MFAVDPAVGGAALVAGGLFALVLGAEFVVRAGASLAGRLGMQPMMIGLTVIAIGTSTPELAVGVEAALDGVGDLAVGNIAGTNLVNLLLILGLSALLKPLAIHGRTLALDLPMMAVAALALLVLAGDLLLSIPDGALLLAIVVPYTVVILLSSRRDLPDVRAEYEHELEEQPYAVAEAETRLAVGTAPGQRTSVEPARRVSAALVGDVGVLVVAIAVTLVGADWLVHGATQIAQQYAVSDAVIGLTIVAIGTSAPELVTSVLATFRHHRDIAIGNLIGSSVYNIALILGVTVLVAGGIPISPELARVDIPLMALATLACAPVFLSGRRMSRLEGGLFVSAYVVYLSYLLLTRT